MDSPRQILLRTPAITAPELTFTTTTFNIARNRLVLFLLLSPLLVYIFYILISRKNTLYYY